MGKEVPRASSIWGVILVVTIIAGGILGDFYGCRRCLLIGLAMTVAANSAAMITVANHLHIVMHLATLAAAALVLPLALAPLYIFYRGRECVMAFAWYILATSMASVFAVQAINIWDAPLRLARGLCSALCNWHRGARPDLSQPAGKPRARRTTP